MNKIHAISVYVNIYMNIVEWNLGSKNFKLTSYYGLICQNFAPHTYTSIPVCLFGMMCWQHFHLFGDIRRNDYVKGIRTKYLFTIYFLSKGFLIFDRFKSRDISRTGKICFVFTFLLHFASFFFSRQSEHIEISIINVQELGQDVLVWFTDGSKMGAAVGATELRSNLSKFFRNSPSVDQATQLTLIWVLGHKGIKCKSFHAPEPFYGEMADDGNEINKNLSRKTQQKVD